MRKTQSTGPAYWSFWSYIFISSTVDSCDLCFSHQQYHSELSPYLSYSVSAFQQSCHHHQFLSHLKSYVTCLLVLWVTATQTMIYSSMFIEQLLFTWQWKECSAQNSVCFHGQYIPVWRGRQTQRNKAGLCLRVIFMKKHSFYCFSCGYYRDLIYF